MKEFDVDGSLDKVSNFERTSDKAGQVLIRILDTPGLLEHEIRDGILYLRFEHGIIDMTLPLVNSRDSWEKITSEVETG